jgi:hypothetical protein
LKLPESSGLLRPARTEITAAKTVGLKPTPIRHSEHSEHHGHC